MDKQSQVESIINNAMLWSAGGGALPIPVADIAAVSAIQVDMLTKLGKLYNVDISEERAKTFIAAVAGTTLVRYAISAIKLLPGFGTLTGSALGIATGAASTYALGYVAVSYFEGEVDLDDIDVDEAREAYAKAYETGKQRASDMEKAPKKHAKDNVNPLKALEKLGKLREKKVITKEEFEAKKAELLTRI